MILETKFVELLKLYVNPKRQQFLTKKSMSSITAKFLYNFKKICKSI